MLLTHLEVKNAELDRRRGVSWLWIKDYSKVKQYNVNWFEPTNDNY